MHIESLLGKVNTMSTCEVELSQVILDLAAGPFGSNLKVSCFVEDGFPIIDGANLKGFRVTDNVTKFVTEEKARLLARSIAKRNDVVVTISGTVGQIAYIPMDSKYSEYLCSQRQFRVTFDETKAYVPYIVFYFHTYEGRQKILAFANQTGVPALSQPLKNFKKIRMVLPDLDTQKAIAGVIELLNSKIENNNHINDNLLSQAQAIFDYSYQVADFQQPFTSLIHVLGGGTPKTGEAEFWNGRIPFFTPKDVGRPYAFKTEKTITEAGLEHCNSRLFPKNTTFVTARGTVGKVSLAGRPMAMNQSCYALASDLIDPILVYFYALRAVNSLKHKASGAVFDAIVTRDFDTETISVISETESSRLLSLITPMMSAIHANAEENLRLASLRDSLLPKLMTGEIDVSAVSI